MGRIIKSLKDWVVEQKEEEEEEEVYTKDEGYFFVKYINDF